MTAVAVRPSVPRNNPGAKVARPRRSVTTLASSSLLRAKSLTVIRSSARPLSRERTKTFSHQQIYARQQMGDHVGDRDQGADTLVALGLDGKGALPHFLAAVPGDGIGVVIVDGAQEQTLLDRIDDIAVVYPQQAQRRLADVDAVERHAGRADLGQNICRTLESQGGIGIADNEVDVLLLRQL